MLAYFAIFTTIVLFSTIEVFLKMINGNIDPFLIGFTRFFVSGILLITIGLLFPAKKEKVDFNAWKKIILLGIFGVSIGLGAFHFSIKYLTASTGAVIFSINPIFSSITALVLLRESLGIKNISGMIIGFAGIYILSFGFNAVEINSLVGVLGMLISAIVFGSYIVISKKYVLKYGTFITTGIAFFSGSFLFLPFVKSYELLNPKLTISVVAYITIMATAVAYIFYFYGLKKVPVVVGTSMFYLKPVIASILAVILLSEKLKYNFYIGLFLVMTGLLITGIKRKVKEKNIIDSTLTVENRDTLR